MNLQIKIDKPAKAKQRSVFINDHHKPDYFLKEDELQDLLQQAHYGSWGKDSKNGKELGQQLFNLLNRNNGQLQNALEQCTKKDEELFIYLNLPSDLTEIPFELLYYQDFIVLQPKVHLVRLVKEKKKVIKTEDRPLKILFVAASPLDLKHATLHFEKEEDNIFKITKKYPIDFQVEDTGSLDGIEHTLYEIKGTDILHISGHAGHDKKLGPVFCMEDEIGKIDEVTPDKLFKAIKDIPPKILFLSGCSTGKKDKNMGVESFAYQMVEKGIPIVLSWGLPVSDIGATSFAGVLYEKLSKGSPLGYALKEARLSLKDRYHPWPLMRLFSNGTQCQALVEKAQNILKKTTRQVIHKNLKDSSVRILDKGFVGRRRQLQKSLAVLKNKEPYSDKYGILIHGPAGVGKSCLAGRIFERQTLYDIIVLRGKLEQTYIIHEFKAYFDKKGHTKALTIWGADLSYEEKIKQLFRTLFQEKNIIIYFDDFEDNLFCENDTWYLKSEFINNFRPFLQFIDYADNQSKITITSRYPFELQAEGENLSKKFLADISLMSFTGPDENKKIFNLPHIIKSEHLDLYRQFGHGNPRLLDWLDTIAAEEEKYDLKELKKNLKGKEEDYIRTYLADIMAKAEGTDFQQFLYHSAVYRLPVEAKALEKFSNKRLLQIGVDLTLFEQESVTGQKDTFWVMPVIRQHMWEKLQNEEKKEAQKTALQWYDSFLQNRESLPYHNEAMLLALSLNKIDLAAKHVLPLGEELNNLLYYQQQKELLEQVIEKINNDMIQQAKKDKKQSISTLFNQYAGLIQDLGDAKKAVEYYNQALKIDLAVFGDKHPSVATDYNNLGGAYQDLGDAKKAVEYYNQALKIDLAVFGDKHPEVINDYLTLASFFKSENNPEEELEYLLKVFEILKETIGVEHELTQKIKKRIDELEK